MNRDMDVIRQIVLAVADSTTAPVGSVPGVEGPVFARHAQWLAEAGLVQAALLPKGGMQPATDAMIWRLTWAGCDFADSVRSDTIWKKAKETVIKPSASWSFDVLLDWLKHAALDQLGGLIT